MTVNGAPLLQYLGRLPRRDRMTAETGHHPLMYRHAGAECVAEQHPHSVPDGTGEGSEE
ncbi:MAG: hypothetical protein LBS42_11035 [Tannerella sp.]|nr:hypothetical protein [Tannerella sp.]